MRYCVTTWIARFTCVPLLLLACSQAVGQSDNVSPYSIYGAGVPLQRQSVAQAGMGGAGMAFFQPFRSNFANPAAQAYYLDPIFDLSGVVSYSAFEASSGLDYTSNFRINAIALSLPLQRGKWGLSFGILPLTTKGYNVTIPGDSAGLSSQPIYNYSGDGGINQAFLGMGKKLWVEVDTAGNVTTLAFGAQANFNFGTIDKNRRVTFPAERSIASATEIKESLLVRDWNGDFGLMFQTNIIKRSLSQKRYLKLLLGATYSLAADLNTQRNLVAYSFKGDVGVVGLDTIEVLNRQFGSQYLPQRFGFSIGLDYVSNEGNRLALALDYATQNWSEFRSSFDAAGSNFSYANSSRWSAGVEFTPELGSTKYLSNADYRIGVYQESSYLRINDRQLNDIGISFGTSLPLQFRRNISKSAFHIAAQLGRYGTQEAQLIEESYVRVFVGFTFTPHFRNRWFVQPKYD